MVEVMAGGLWGINGSLPDHGAGRSGGRISQSGKMGPKRLTLGERPTSTRKKAGCQVRGTGGKDKKIVRRRGSQRYSTKVPPEKERNTRTHLLFHAGEKCLRKCVFGRRALVKESREKSGGLPNPVKKNPQKGDS